jgi:hypothetical protein
MPAVIESSNGNLGISRRMVPVRVRYDWRSLSRAFRLPSFHRHNIRTAVCARRFVVLFVCQVQLQVIFAWLSRRCGPLSHNIMRRLDLCYVYRRSQRARHFHDILSRGHGALDDWVHYFESSQCDCNQVAQEVRRSVFRDPCTSYILLHPAQGSSCCWRYVNCDWQINQANVDSLHQICLF